MLPIKTLLNRISPLLLAAALLAASGKPAPKVPEPPCLQLSRSLTGHVGWVMALAFSPDGKMLAFGSQDGTARLWDLASGKELRVLNGNQGTVWGASFSPEGKRLATAGDDHTLKLWDADSGLEITASPPQPGSVPAVVFSPDGKILAAGACGQTDSDGVCVQGAVNLYSARCSVHSEADSDHEVVLAFGARLTPVA